MQLIAEIAKKYNADSQKLLLQDLARGANMSSAISLTESETQPASEF